VTALHPEIETNVATNGYHRRRQTLSQVFAVLCLLATSTCVLILALVLFEVLWQGLPWINWNFLSTIPSPDPNEAGILPALVSSLWLIILTGLFTVPIGVGAAIYLEEYATASRWRNLVQLNIANLAGVPSIVYGILGLGLFVRALSLQRSILAGALTLTLVVLPIVILAAQESLRAVPSSIRQASYALGATRWQTVWHQVLPAATPGIMTGVILAMSRALGEAAPLVAIGAATFLTFVPMSPSDEFSALPMQIFYWARRPEAEFHHVAAAAIVVLLTVLILMNATAVWVRYHYGKRVRW
jgi:phosphate transport system permease protein